MALQNQLPGSKTDLIRRSIEPVYRYHLARSENYLEAQNLTAHTFLSLLKGVDTHRADGDRGLKVWILGQARFQQTFGRRHSTPAGLHLAKPDAGQPDKALESRAYPGSPSPIEEVFQMDQAEVLLRDQMAHLSSSWRSLPRKQADALALHFFGGLNPAEAGKVLRISENDVDHLLTRQTFFSSELIDLASSIHPDPNFVHALLDLLEKEGTSRLSIFSQRPDLSTWQPYITWQTLIHSGGHVWRTGLLVGTMVIGLFTVLHGSATGSPPAASPPATPLATQPLPAAPLDGLGNLVPPAQAVCQEWQANLGKATGQVVSLTEAVYNDPTQSNVDAKGTGCAVSTLVLDWDLQGAWPTFDQVSEMLLANNFTEQDEVTRYLGFGGPSYFGKGCIGMGRTFSSSSDAALLTISWCPQDSTAQSNGTSTPPTGEQTAIRQGGMSTYLGPYTVKITLASKTLDAFLTDFFTQWANGSSQAVSFLSPSLAKRFPGTPSLDRLAGIKRNPGQTILFNWQVIDNSGTHLRLQILPSDPAVNGLSALELKPFQMTLTQDKDGVWVVQGLGQAVPFS